MPYSGDGAIWTQEQTMFVARNVAGSQAEYDAAKAAISAGIFYVGPGLEALALGAFGPNVCLMLVTTTGVYGISRLHVLDGADPTRRHRFDASAISPGTTRVGALPDWDGAYLLPADLGTLGQFLKSNGPGAQPSWATGGSGINALLDGANHTDTVAQAVLRGSLILGNATPKWDRLPIGALDTLLKSDGADPSWGTVALLSAFHDDTLSGSPVRGDLIVANATPLWTKLGIGAADTFLGSNGSDPGWKTAAQLAAIIQALIDHSGLLHLKPFQVSGNVTINNGSAVLTDASAGGRFANVRVGDRINLDEAHYNPQLFGMVAITSGASDPNNITVNLTNTGSTQTGATATVYPGDHYDDTLLDGLVSTGGVGTYDGTGAGTVPIFRGSRRYTGYVDGSMILTVDSVQSTGALTNGFNVKKLGSAARAFHYAGLLSGDHVVSYPNGDGVLLLADLAQNVTQKSFVGGNEYQCDDIVGNANGGHFADYADPTKELYFDLTGISAPGQKAKWPDFSPGGPVDFAYVSQTTAINAKVTGTTNLFTVPSGKNFVCTRAIVRCTAASAITVGPTFGIGVAAGEDDIIASAAHTLLIASGTYVSCLIRDPAAIATSTQVIKLGIDAAATGTSMTLTVEIAGYLV